MKAPKVRSFAFLISIIALILTAPSHFYLFALSDQLIHSVSTPEDGVMPVAPLSVDLNLDGQPDQITHHHGSLKISSQDLVLWNSPRDWKIDQFEITDLNHDDIPEITLLLWREFSPWPIDAYIPHPGRIDDFHDRENRSCHIILIGYRHGAIQELWAGSALASPIIAFTPADINHDGRQELIALESQYDAHILAGASITTWEWNGFGFTLLSRGPHGYFSTLSKVQTFDGQELLLVQGIFRR